MKSLSQSDFADFRNLYESMYTPEEEFEINEELIDEVFDELVEEFIKEGHTEEDAIEIVDEAVDLYIDEVLCEVSDSYYDSAVRASKKAAKGIDKAARQKRRAGQVRYAKRKAGEVFKRGKEVAGAVKAGASLAKDFAGDELRRAGRKAVHSATKAADAVKSAPGKARDKAKKGIKGMIGKVAKKVASKASDVAKRMSEEIETLKTTGLFSDSEIEAIMEADSLAAMQARREKRLAAQRKREGTTATGRDFGHDYSLTPAQQKARRDAEYKAGIGTKKEEVEVDEAMSSYDRNRKRAAQRAAARNAARDAGKTGVVPGVGYVSPRRERETYVDSAGTTRHKSGAKMPKD